MFCSLLEFQDNCQDIDCSTTSAKYETNNKHTYICNVFCEKMVRTLLQVLKYKVTKCAECRTCPYK